MDVDELLESESRNEYTRKGLEYLLDKLTSEDGEPIEDLEHTLLPGDWFLATFLLGA